MKRVLAVLGMLMTFPCLVLAQSHESADAVGAGLDVGAQFSVFNPDYYCPSSSPFDCGGPGHLMKGIGAFADYRVLGRLGIEGEGRWLLWDGGGQTEGNYLVGPRFRVLRIRKFALFPKFLVGAGTITTAHYPAPGSVKGSFFVYAPGATVGYKVSRKVTLRADYELQRWPGFGVTLNGVHHGAITPTGFSFGASYKVFGR